MKYSYEQVLKSELFKPAQQPDIVYHLTTRANAEKILKDGAVIPAANDYMTFFTRTIEDMFLYIHYYNLDNGSLYYDIDGFVHKKGPLVYSDNVIMKLKPRYSNNDEWFTEDNTYKCKSDGEKELVRLSDATRIMHYGRMRFYTNAAEIYDLETLAADYKERDQYKKAVKEFQAIQDNLKRERG